MFFLVNVKRAQQVFRDRATRKSENKKVQKDKIR